MKKARERKKREYRHLPAFILLVLTDGPAHGGAVHGALSRILPGYTADTGALYRALQAMERDGELESKWDLTNPGPPRKIYKLTPTGREKLTGWKKEIEARLRYLNVFLKHYKQIKKPGKKSRQVTNPE